MIPVAVGGSKDGFTKTLTGMFEYGATKSVPTVNLTALAEIALTGIVDESLGTDEVPSFVFKSVPFTYISIRHKEVVPPTSGVTGTSTLSPLDVRALISDMYAVRWISSASLEEPVETILPMDGKYLTGESV